MLEILLLLALIMPVLAAKRRGSRRSMRGYMKGDINEKIDLGTLAASTLISANIGETVIERTLISSIVTTWSLSEFTQAVGDGPIVVGVANSDYTDSEIEQVLENNGSWNAGSLVDQEKTKRKVRIIGTFQQKDISVGNSVLNDGKPIKTKLNWVLETGQTLSLWAYNDGESALATTDPDVNVFGHANLFTL